VRVAASSVVLAVLMAGCALRPIEDDIELGARVAAAMEAEVGLYPDDDVRDYVVGVAERVADKIEAPQFEYRFAVLDQAAPNAFAAPGGWVFVSRGLLATAQSEDELAGVLGHEMTHVEKRHSAEASRPRLLASILALPGNLVGLVLPRVGGLANAPIETVEALRSASYGRGQEAESDRIGLEIAARAGYDPSALAGVLGRMEKVVAEMTGKAAEASYFDTHPPTPSRIGDIHHHAGEVEAAQRSPDARDDEAFLRGLDGLVWGENPARGVFRENRFLDPLLKVGITFPTSWQTVSTAAFAGAARKDGKAAVFFSVPATTPAEASERIKSAKDKLGADGFDVHSDEGFELAGRRMRMIEFHPRSRRDDRLVIQGWTRIGKVYGEFLAVGTKADRDDLVDVIMSLRDLSAVERLSITVTRVRIVEAQAGETVRQLHRRTGSAVSPGMVAALNGLELSSPLQAGQLIKIVREEAFP